MKLERKHAKQLCQDVLSTDAYWQVNKKLAIEFGAEVAIAMADLINVEKMLDRDGNLPKDDWFFQSIADIEKYTGLNRHSQEKALAKLRVQKFIEQMNRGQPRRRWFRIDYEALLKYFSGGIDDE